VVVVVLSLSEGFRESGLNTEEGICSLESGAGDWKE